MVVMILENVPRSLRGELTRWLVEVDTGVFVGRVSATVRDLLWIKCVQKACGGRCCLAYRSNTEQGFSLRMDGYEDRRVQDFDGLQLVTVTNAEALRNGKWIRWQKEREAGRPPQGQAGPAQAP
jgi:CRISPR-associated protein Cas2